MIAVWKENVCLLSLAVAIALGAACGKEPEAVAIEEAPKAIEKGFAGAPAPAKEAATEAVQALQSQNPGRAFVSLQELSTRSDITPEQREAATKSLMAVRQQLNDAAARGDKNAQQILELHRSRK